MLLVLLCDFLEYVVALNLFIYGLSPESSGFNCENILHLGFDFQ